jgi:hypothetical protein
MIGTVGRTVLRDTCGEGKFVLSEIVRGGSRGLELAWVGWQGTNLEADLACRVHPAAISPAERRWCGVGWRIARNLIATRIHALRIGLIVALLESHLRLLGGGNPDGGSG